MKYTIATTKKFDKAVVRCISRGYNISKLHTAMSLLEENGTLPSSYSPHKWRGAKGNNTWECHLEPDWLLFWEQHDNELLMVMITTGTHSDVFGKKQLK